MIILRNRFTGLILPERFPAICIWPFILIRPGRAMASVNEIVSHERIHGRQQIEMAWVFFFIWYALEFLVRFAILRNFMMAYHNLSHEKEAYLNDNNPDYLQHRKSFAWTQYL